MSGEPSADEHRAALPSWLFAAWQSCRVVPHWLGVLEPAPARPLRTRARPNHTLTLVQAGRLSVQARRVRLEVTAGWACLVPPQLPVRILAEVAGNRVLSLDFSLEPGPTGDPLQKLSLPAAAPLAAAAVPPPVIRHLEGIAGRDPRLEGSADRLAC